MKLAHIGLGGMGTAIQTQAFIRGHQSVSSIKAGDPISPTSLNQADIAIECTVPSAFWDNFEALCEAQQDTLIITTGWYDEIERLETMVKKSGIRAMWSSNYSIGVNLYFRIIEAAAKLINKAEDYDVWGTEIHHKNKIDSPSGTAKTLEQILLENIGRKTDVVEEALQRKIKDHELHFSSTRGGLTNFEHTIGFDSEADGIQIKHFARSRDGYAIGAIKCAEWLQQQKPGLYSMEDYWLATFN